MRGERRAESVCFATELHHSALNPDCTRGTHTAALSRLSIHDSGECDNAIAHWKAGRCQIIYILYSNLDLATLRQKSGTIEPKGVAVI